MGLGQARKPQPQAHGVRPRSPATWRLCWGAELPCQCWGPCRWPWRQGNCNIPGRMNGAQCGGWAELRAPFVLPRVAVRSAAGDLPAGGCPTGPPQPVLEAGHARLHTPHTPSSPPCSLGLDPHQSAASTEPCRSRLSHTAPRSPALSVPFRLPQSVTQLPAAWPGPVRPSTSQSKAFDSSKPEFRSWACQSPLSIIFPITKMGQI